MYNYAYDFVVSTLKHLAAARHLVKAMLEIPSKGKGIDHEVLKHIKSCTSNDTRVSHGHAPFCDLVTELSGTFIEALNTRLYVIYLL